MQNRLSPLKIIYTISHCPPIIYLFDILWPWNCIFCDFFQLWQDYRKPVFIWTKRFLRCSGKSSSSCGKATDSLSPAFRQKEKIM